LAIFTVAAAAELPTDLNAAAVLSFAVSTVL
jgi:hypothetical protein